ncbi:hypothetical protein BGX24_008674, partial [Mortierella sp. AD032]
MPPVRHMPAINWKSMLERVVKNRPYTGFIKEAKDRALKVTALSPSTEETSVFYERRMALQE